MGINRLENRGRNTEEGEQQPRVKGIALYGLVTSLQMELLKVKIAISTNNNNN